MRHLLVKGEINCVLVHLEGISRGEIQSTSFSYKGDIPDLHFSRGEVFRFFLQVKEEEEKSPLTQLTKKSRHGTLSFNVFLPGVHRAVYTGSQNFSPELIKSEQFFRWENIAVNQYPKGRMGVIAVELELKILV